MKSLVSLALAALTVVPTVLGFTSLTTTQRNLAYQITSTWENEIYDKTTESWVLDYSYCQNNHDGQGITVGFTGFTTNGGDALSMVDRYNAINPNNVFVKTSGLLSCMKKVVNTGNVKCFSCHDTNCYTSTLCKAVSSAYANDRDNFIQAQLGEDGQDNWIDSQNLAMKYNIWLPLSQAFLYDSCVNHACDYTGNDVQGYIIKRALNGASSVGNTTSEQEAFFNAMLASRKSYMCDSNGCDCCSDSTWRIPGWSWLGNTMSFWDLPNLMKIKTFQDGKNAPVWTFQCNPNQFPGCSVGPATAKGPGGNHKAHHHHVNRRRSVPARLSPQ